MAVLVLDVNVIAGYLLGAGADREELSAFLLGPFDFIAPDIWRPELGNTLWKYIQKREITLDEAVALFQRAEPLVSDTISSRGLWQLALLLAAQNNHPVYDCLFIALAVLEDTMLVSYDRRLARKFGERVALPAELLA
ncbi:MAG: type II toxin-antitoxin system VapC family toxin [Candidatus Marinimicrobia bacterium]|nr:type II toxin-antitoxin system VapC family toxin [Candidatus Neomarinimicrobiota bacterium]